MIRLDIQKGNKISLLFLILLTTKFKWSDMKYPMRYFIYLKCTSTSQSPELQCQLRVIQKFKFQVCFMPIISCISWDTKFSRNHFYCGVKSSTFTAAKKHLYCDRQRKHEIIQHFKILLFTYRNMQKHAVLSECAN